jgi:hypothetical protein
MPTPSRLRSFVARDLLLRDAAVSDATYERRHAGLRLVLLAHIVVIAGYATAAGRAQCSPSSRRSSCCSGCPVRG